MKQYINEFLHKIFLKVPYGLIFLITEYTIKKLETITIRTATQIIKINKKLFLKETGAKFANIYIKIKPKISTEMYIIFLSIINQTPFLP
ncbi:hypothetical protein CMALT394_210064 [Carnobacterium maltaromaticum]|nr:hypothetical protein CMALT394_210064 [Carnobacterium maltaromaticum]